MKIHKISRIIYIIQTIDHYTKDFKKNRLNSKLKKESKPVAKESIKVLKEFDFYIS